MSWSLFFFFWPRLHCSWSLTRDRVSESRIVKDFTVVEHSHCLTASITSSFGWSCCRSKRSKVVWESLWNGVTRRKRVGGHLKKEGKGRKEKKKKAASIIAVGDRIRLWIGNAMLCGKSYEEVYYVICSVRLFRFPTRRSLTLTITPENQNVQVPQELCVGTSNCDAFSYRLWRTFCAWMWH